jgi:hypothetical protein
LFRWTLVAFFVAIFVVEEPFERLDELGLLVLDVLLVRVAWEVNIFPFSGLLGCGARCSLAVVVGWVEWLLLVELVEARAVLDIFDFWDEWRLLRSYIVPIDSLEERVVLNLLNSTRSQSVIDVTKKPFQDIS